MSSEQHPGHVGNPESAIVGLQAVRSLLSLSGRRATGQALISWRGHSGSRATLNGAPRGFTGRLGPHGAPGGSTGRMATARALGLHGHGAASRDTGRLHGHGTASRARGGFTGHRAASRARGGFKGHGMAPRDEGCLRQKRLGRVRDRVWNGLDQSTGFIIQPSPGGFGLDWIRNSPTQRILDWTGSRNGQCVSHI